GAAAVSRLCAVLLALVLAQVAQAHESRPAYLELDETAPGRFDLLWRTPVLAGMRLPLELQLPDEVREVRPAEISELADSRVERRWLDAGHAGLAGRRIGFAGLQLTITDVLVRVQVLDGRSWTAIARGSQPWVELAGSQSAWEVAATYLVQGMRHILFGADHLLFVLGLLLIVRDRWMLVKTVTAFTLAHSLTLGVAAPPLSAAEGGDRALDPLPRAGDRAEVARRDELHDPPPLGGRVRVRPPARLRLRDGADRRRIAARRPAARADRFQRRRRAG